MTLAAGVATTFTVVSLVRALIFTGSIKLPTHSDKVVNRDHTLSIGSDSSKFFINYPPFHHWGV